MKKPAFWLVFLVSCGACLSMSKALADEVFVDCERGDTFEEALYVKHVKFLEPIRVWFAGTCTESFVIDRDDVDIVGKGNAELIGGIFIDDAKSILLRRFKVTGPDTGIVVSGGSASAEIDRVNLDQNDGFGLEIVGGASVVLTNRTVTGNHSGVIVSSSVLQVDDNSSVSNNLDAGVLGLDNSSIIVSNSEIRANPGTGVFLRNGSTALLNNATVSANGEGMVLTAGSVLIEAGTEISGNNDNGIRAELHSSVQIEDASIYENQLAGVRLLLDSGLFNSYGQANFYANGGPNVVCDDTESSVLFLGNAPDGISCTDYNQTITSP